MTSAVRASGFEIGPEIGRGGFGVVYRARQVDLSRTVALKVLAGGVVSPDERRRFEHECHIVGSLPAHPAIVSVFHAGVTDTGVPFLAMAHLPGGTLGDRSPMTADETARVGAVLADALAVAHAGGVIHRDVKPSNVLFTADDEPVLVDFGIASLAGEGPTSSGSIALSLAYASPETLEGAEVGAPTDVYALGATLFAALTGRAPFSVPGDNGVTRIAMRIANEPVEDLRPRGVPDGLCRVIETAMAKRPERRFASMAAMRDALDAVRAGDEASLSALLSAGALTTAPGRRPTSSRRSRAALVAAAAAVVLGGGGYAAYALTGDSTDGHPAADRTGGQSRQPNGQAAAPLEASRSGSTSSAGSDPDVGKPGVLNPPRQRVRVVGAGRTTVTLNPRTGRIVRTTVGPSTRAPSAPKSTPPKATAPPTSTPPTTKPPVSKPRRATLAGHQRCEFTAVIGKTVSVPARCDGWRGDWSPANDSANRRVVFVTAAKQSSNRNAKLVSSGYSVTKHTWTVRASAVTNAHFYYRIRASYRGSDRKWRSAGNSTNRDWILVHFVKA